MPDPINQEAIRAAQRLRKLLEEARIEIRVRLAHQEPGGSREEILRQMDAAVGGALDRLSGNMERELAASRERTVELGVAEAAKTLPDAEMRVLFRLDQGLLDVLGAWEAGLVTGVTGDLRAQITRQVQLGTLAGKSMREITDEVTAARGKKGEALQPVGPFRKARDRAEVIAVTETHRIANIAIHARYEDAATRIPRLQKQWVTAEDGRVRPDHYLVNGVTIPMGEKFSVGGEKAEHPLDPALSAKQSVRCRCRLVAVVPEDEEEPGALALASQAPMAAPAPQSDPYPHLDPKLKKLLGEDIMEWARMLAGADGMPQSRV